MKLFARIFSFVVLIGFLLVGVLSITGSLPIYFNQNAEKSNHNVSFTYVVFIDPEFSELEKGLLIDGLRDWEYKTHHIVQFYVVGSDRKLPKTDGPILYRAIAFQREDAMSPLVMYIEAMIRTDIVGYFDENNLLHHDTLTILIVPDSITSLMDFRAIVEHEVAHSFGLRHTKEKHTLMWWMDGDDSAECITQQDLHQFCKLYHCDDEQMLGCADESEWFRCYNQLEAI